MTDSIITSFRQFLRTYPYADEKQSFKVDFVLIYEFNSFESISFFESIYVSYNNDNIYYKYINFSFISVITFKDFI
jgi:hypothetical protein